MPKIVPREIFLTHRALKETTRAVNQISHLFHGLAEAMRTLEGGLERSQIILDEASLKLALQKVSRDRLFRQFQSALDSPNLETLIEARDAYLQLLLEENHRRALRRCQ